jgi:hypothetical protein
MIHCMLFLTVVRANSYMKVLFKVIVLGFIFPILCLLRIMRFLCLVFGILKTRKDNVLKHGSVWVLG